MTTWLHRLRKRLLPFRADSDIADELHSHFEALTEEGLESGLTAQEARRRARLRLGVSQNIVENVREGEISTVLESVYRDLALGFRSLRRSPGFAVTAVLTLAVGIGANTIVFTLLHGLLLRSLPVKDPSSVVRIAVLPAGADPRYQSDTPYRMMQQLRRQQRSFTDISAWQRNRVAMETEDGGGQVVALGLVGGNGFEVLGMSAHLGRLLVPADDVPGGPAEGWPVVLGYDYWQEVFGGDPAAVGKRFKLAGSTVTVAGVAPRDFRGLSNGSETRLYLPLHFADVLAGRSVVDSPNNPFWVATIARLKPGVSIAAARAELTTYEKTLVEDFIPVAMRERFQLRNAILWVSSARSGLPNFFGRVYSTPLYLMQGLVAIVLVLCCVNIAGLMMAKIHSRRLEFAVRTAIGAARWRIIRQYLTESFAIAVGGASLGAAAAWYGTGYLLPFFRHPNEGTGLAIQPDSTVLAVTAFFAVFTTMLFGTLPAWRAGAADCGTLLGARTAEGARRRFFGRTFIPLQVALSFALVSIATLLSQSLIRLETEQTGFDLDHVTIQTAPFHLLNQPVEMRLELYHRMKARMEQMPGMHAVSFTRLTPMTSFQATSSFQAVSAGPNPPEDPRMPYNNVGPGYFHTMKTAILAGREFQDHERDRSVCVLNQSAAAFLFPRQEAVGQYVRGTDARLFPTGSGTCRVVGLAQDAKYANLHEPPPRTIYFPIQASDVAGNLVFLLNAPAKAQAIAAYRKAKSELTPATPLVLFVTLREQMEAALGSQRALSLMSNFFAAMALLLSGLGLYGLLSSTVAQRTSEIGVRMALGAERGRVLRMVLSEAFVLLGAGLGLGAIVLFATVRYVSGMLYGVSAFDPVRLVAITAVLAVVTVVAGLAPAVRAASIDPIQALRAE
jgi:predicted permease